MRKLIGGIVFTLCTALAATAFAAQKAGEVDELDGDAQAVLDGKSRALDEGDDVFSGEKIITAAESKIKIIFEDETEFNIGPDGELLIDEFVYDPDRESGQIAMSVLKGGFRFLSGKAAKTDPKSMNVTLPVATIGIRGTHVVGEVKDGKAGIALMENEDGSTGSKIIVANNAGSVTIDQPGYGTDVAGKDVAPTPPRRWEMQRLNTITRMIRRVAVPRPRMIRP